MMRRAVILFSLVVLAGSAQAMLSPDASAREPQIRAYRQKVREKFEQRQVERQAEAVRAYERTRADIFTPPWMRGKEQSALQPGAGSSSSGQDKAVKRNHRFLVSAVLLILIGAVAGWVRYATREVDE